MTAWDELTSDQRWEGFERLNLPSEVEFNCRQDKMEIRFPRRLLDRVLDTLLDARQVSFTIDVYKDGIVIIDALTGEDLGEEETP